MSSLNIREFATIGLDERIPEASRVVGNALPVQSVIVGRRTQKFLPVNGSTFTESQNPTFKMSANSDFLIPSSATLHFKLRNKSANAGTSACFDDTPGTSVFNRAILRASGVLVEDILEVARSTTAMTYTHMSPERYSKQGSIDTHNWKWNRDFRTDAQASVELDVSAVDAANPTEAEINTAINPVQALAEGLRLDEKGVDARQVLASEEATDDTAGEIEVNVPMSYFFGTFRTNKLLPLSFLGQLEVEFTMAQAVRAIVDTAGGAVDYEIKETYITAHMAQLSDDYLKVLASSFASPEPAMAYNLPVDTITNITQNKSVNSATDTLNSYVYSKSTPFLKNILFTSQNNTQSATTYSASGMPSLLGDSPQVRLFIGSEVFPQYGVLDSAEEIMRHNMIGLGAQGNVQAQYGLVSRENFKNQTDAGGIQYVLFSFAKVNGLGEEYYDLDSYDASLQGAVLDYQVGQKHPSITQANTLAIIEHTRIMRIGGGRLEVKA